MEPYIDKPFSPSCERNRDPILAVLREVLADCRSALEIGSGTGQHAVYFAAGLPHLQWQTSDRAENLPGIRLWLADAAQQGQATALPPFEFDVAQPWPPQATGIAYDAYFTANTLHIMPWEAVLALFAGLKICGHSRSKLLIYGPFNYGGRFTSDSNAAFDASLRASAPHQGIRDIEAVLEQARGAGFGLVEDRAMPANNRCLVLQRGV